MYECVPLLPGERGDAHAAKVKREGVIDVEPNLWKGLQELAATYVLPPASSASYKNGAAPAVPAADGGKMRPGGEHGWGVATRLIHPRDTLPDPFNATAPPLYQAGLRSQSLLLLVVYRYALTSSPS